VAYNKDARLKSIRESELQHAASTLRISFDVYCTGQHARPGDTVPTKREIARVYRSALNEAIEAFLVDETRPDATTSTTNPNGPRGKGHQDAV
jgi:LmbE family N-acetylglucosaminyl deacetylase